MAKKLSKVRVKATFPNGNTFYDMWFYEKVRDSLWPTLIKELFDVVNEHNAKPHTKSFAELEFGEYYKYSLFEKFTRLFKRGNNE